MKVSTKGRYALRIMIDLGQHPDGNFISLKDIAERQKISMKYLESIVSLLNKAGLLDSYRGKTGGYRLNKPVEEYTVGSIIKLTEGSLAPVSCLQEGQDHVNCSRAAECLTLPMWQHLDRLIDTYLESVTLSDLIYSKVQV